MSFLARAFGAGPSKKEHGPSTQEAIQRLRTTEEMLQKKSDYLEKKIDSETNIARSNASKNKRGISCVTIKQSELVSLLLFHDLSCRFIGQ